MSEPNWCTESIPGHFQTRAMHYHDMIGVGVGTGDDPTHSGSVGSRRRYHAAVPAPESRSVSLYLARALAVSTRISRVIE